MVDGSSSGRYSNGTICPIHLSREQKLDSLDIPGSTFDTECWEGLAGLTDVVVPAMALIIASINQI
jgi:hypothetical protein